VRNAEARRLNSIRITPSSSPSAPARFEEVLESLGEGFGGTETEGVHAGAAEGAVQFGEAFGVGIGKFLADGGAGGVHFEELAGFGVLDGEQTGGGQRAFARVVQVEANEVVPGIGKAEFLESVASRAR
jgi:hypothetical protein